MTPGLGAHALGERWRRVTTPSSAKHPRLKNKEPHKQLGTLGGGNHFIEVCLDTEQTVWVMLHSGSRGIGNLIGQLFIELARKDMKKHFINLPDQDLAYLVEGTDHFDDYVEAMTWAQDYAAENRRSMMDAVLRVMREELRAFQLGEVAVNCHHNYCTREMHFGEDLHRDPQGRGERAGRASSASSRDRWVRVRTSCADSATPRASRAAATARAA